MYKLKNLTKLTLLLGLAVMLIVASPIVSLYVEGALERVFKVIIPSLYGFMVMAEIMVESNAYKLLGKPFSALARNVFKMDEDIFGIFLISQVGGYPVGSRLVAKLVQNNRLTKTEAAGLLPICYGAGPAFIISFIGNNVFNSNAIGVIIFVSMVITNILIAVISRVFYIKPGKSSGKNHLNNISLSAEKFVGAVNQSGMAIISICFIIVVFSILLALADGLGIWNIFSAENTNVIFQSIFEITLLARLDVHSIALIPIVAALCSFGGMCIVFQVAGLLKGEIPLKRFVFIRLLSMPITFFTCKFLLYLTDLFLPELFKSVSALTFMGDPMVSLDAVYQPSALPSVCILAMSVLLMVILRQNSLRAT